MEMVSQCPKISNDPDTRGFDLSVGNTWIYPENYPVRNYQYSIVQNALYNNTLVCLPTGLGKTFIAAVVMYNFWRWYPRGIVVFLAPTKPLVAQQIHACHNVMGIPSSETVELTGAVSHKRREVAWIKQRVVFATPQVFHNDLENNIVPGELVKCVIVDEAHKALGKHSYCECVRILTERNRYFRILALSATPGNKLDNVHQILRNLHIANLELRDETSPDVKPYINERKVDIVLVPLSRELSQYRDRYIAVMDCHVKVLVRCNVIQCHTANLSKGRVFHLLREYQKKTNKSGSYGQIMKTLNILMTMYHGYELMVRDGLRAFYNFYQNHLDKYWINTEIELQHLLEDMQMYLGPFPDAKSLEGKSLPDIPRNLVFGHTKFEKLQEILLNHFKRSKENQSDTRAIVFVEYRDIVSEIYVLLLQARPLIRPQMFVGQTGQKQKQQIKALEDFRSNHVNVLISTSIGEEGLDVGEVDLIICFDISQHSPTRLVQRMGRTGRKRDGHIIILVTDGREHETLKSTMARRDSLNSKIFNSSSIIPSLYEENPRMIPRMFKPECHKMHINVEVISPVSKKGKKAKIVKEKVEKKKPKRQTTIAKSTAVLESNVGGFLNDKNSITKYLRSEKYNEEENDVFRSSNMAASQTADARSLIKPTDVKVLSCDTDAVDFLTICALKKSEKAAEAANNNVNAFYLPKFQSIKNFFDFSVPSIETLGCLSTLDAATLFDCEKDILHDSTDDVQGIDNSDDINLNDSIVSYVNTEIRVNPFNAEDAFGESKFEDLLDDSSESDNVLPDADAENFEINQNPVSRDFFSISTELKNNSRALNDRASVVQDLGPVLFEDILDESDSSENAPDKCFEEINKNTPAVAGEKGKVANLASEDDIFEVNYETEVNNEKELFEIEDFDWNDDFDWKDNSDCPAAFAENVDWRENKNISCSTPNKRKTSNADDSENDFVVCKKSTRKSAEPDANFSDKSENNVGTPPPCSASTSNDFRDASCRNLKVKPTSPEVFKTPKKYREKNVKKKADYKRDCRRKKNQFICEEAEVSQSNSADDSSETDGDLSDFVSYTQNIQDESPMQAHYLQSIRSPVKRHGAFVFRKPKSRESSVEIYSQELSPEHESYLNDSFCVDDRADISTQIADVSILEEAERRLKKRKRRRDYDDELADNRNKTKKTRRIMLNDSSSSDDELERLRKQIPQDSFL